MRLCRATRERGSMSLEMVLVTPLFVAFLLFLAGAGRMVDAQSQVDGAARDAVRAASIARSAPSAQDLAGEAARAGLQGHDWCSGGPTVVTDVGDWGPGGRVEVTITCDVDLGDLSFIGLPGTKRLQGHALAPIDTFTFRGTGPGEGEDDPE
ncbi:TadE/TadG family type IV pilus assembly protein [Actinomadura macra]|uniref:TadE/TadG family type IV pilus assembly protein n=1 Tax=Actinomadura macra TaxID=46164 RepID=UPI000AF90DE1|nr:TadE family protein [Actinomadura macra]